jgi:MinD superfamily P-loop ATPase
VLITTPEWITSTIVLDALSHLQDERTTVAINKSYLRSADVRAVEDRFRAEHLHRCVTIPYDEQLATMLDSGAYTLDALKRSTRLAIKCLGLAVAEQLV